MDWDRAAEVSELISTILGQDVTLSTSASLPSVLEDPMQRVVAGAHWPDLGLPILRRSMVHHQSRRPVDIATSIRDSFREGHDTYHQIEAATADRAVMEWEVVMQSVEGLWMP